ncbi:hypothetical protein Tco_0283517, partial [Tanacetum coccineum]
SPLALLIWKRYQGTSKLVKDTKDENSDLGTEREGSKGEGHSLEDKGPGLEDVGHGLEDDGPDIEEEEAALEGQQQALLVVDNTMDEPLRLGYEELRRQHEGAERISAFRQPTLVTWVDPKDGRVYTDI